MANYAAIEKMELVDLIELYKEGSDAERAMVTTKVITDNDKLITHLLKKHFPSYIKGHYEDMCQEARIAIAQNFARFDPDKGKFSTYISTYILAAFKWYICELHGISSHYFTQVKRYNQAVSALTAKGCSPITVDMIADEMGVGADAVLAVADVIDRMNNISIEGDEKERSLTDTFVMSPEEYCEQNEAKDILFQALGRLSDKERQVIITTYLNEKEIELPLREVARKLGMDVQHVRRYKNRALRQLAQDDALIRITGGIRDSEVRDFADSLTIEFTVPKVQIEQNLEIAMEIEL